MAERIQQQGMAFTALTRVVAAAAPRAMPTITPHRPPSVKPFIGGEVVGSCCEYCRNSFSWDDLKRHYAGGCPALRAG
jgi:hypothetical protein